MVKKVTSLILVIFLLCTLLTGCQSDDKEKESLSKKIDLRPAPVTIVVYTTYMSNEYLNKVRDLEEKIRDTLNINFDVRLVPNLGQDSDKQIAAIKKFLQSGQEFDLLIVDVPTSYPDLDKTYNNAELIAMEQFMDITDLLPRYAPNYYSRFSTEDLRAISYNRRIYNIPQLQFGSPRPSLLVWKSMLEKYGENMKTFEDFKNYMETIKEKEDYFPCVVFFYDCTQMFIEPYGYVMLCGNIVYRRDDSEMELIPWEQTDAFKEAFSTIRNWREEKYDFWSSNESDNKFTSILEESIPYSVTKNINRFLELPGDEWVVYPLYPDSIITRATPARNIFISKNSKNAERILRFIEWTNESQENYNLGSVICPTNFYYEQNNENEYLYFFDKEGYIDAVTRNSTYPLHAGYTPPMRLMEKISERCDDFEAFLSNNIINTEMIEEFIRQQKEKGIDNLVKELQEDLDAWRSKQLD